MMGSAEAWSKLEAAYRRPGTEYSPEAAWRMLQSCDSDQTKMKMYVIGDFHALALALLHDMSTLLQRKDVIQVRRSLLRWLLEVAKRPVFWLEINRADESGKRPFLDGESAEAFVESLWLEVPMSRAEVASLEKSYRLLSQSASWLLQRSELSMAYRVLRKHYSIQASIPRIVLGLPLVAGTLVGWLFALEGESAVLFALSGVFAASWQESLIHLGLLFGGSLGASLAFVWAANARVKESRAFKSAISLVGCGWLVSMAVGVAFVGVSGSKWVAVPCDLAGGWKLWFALLWAPLALFIGIVAQVFWTGRPASDPGWGDGDA